MRIPAALVLLNAQRGIAALMVRRAEVLAMPGISIEQIESLSDLGQARQPPLKPQGLHVQRGYLTARLGRRKFDSP
jgi:hypothetical protein